MKFFILLSIILNCTVYSYSKEHYSFSDKCINVWVEWSVHTADSETIILKIVPIVDILILNNNGCFSYDSVESAVRFRNIDCPVYLLGDRSYSIYKWIGRNSNLEYSLTVPNRKGIHKFSFGIVYISTSSNSFKRRKKKFVAIHESAKSELLSIDAETELELTSLAFLEIEH